MPEYSGTIRTREGVRTFNLSAKDENEARGYFERSGRIISVRRKRSFSFKQPLSQSDRHIFFTRLSSMLSSRVGQSDALTLIRNTFSGKIHDIAGKLLNYVEAGEDLSSAITKIGAPDFPEATTALIRAGSRSGETWRAIRDAMTFEYQLSAVRKGASKGLIAGVGSMVFAGITTVASTSYMGPKLMKSELMKAAMQKGNGIHLEWVTTVGNIVGYAIAAILVLIFLMLILASAGRKIMPVKADQLIMRIPYYKDLVLSRNNYIVLYGLSLLIGSGVRTEEALRLSATTAPPGALKKDLLDAEKAVKGGREWAKEMKTLHPTDVAALLSAQDRKQIMATLDTLASQYKELYAYRLASFVPALNMVAALFMSIAGGILFAESILPMLMATQNIM